MNLKRGTINFDGKDYEYEVLFEDGDYRTFVENCREACRITGYEPEEHHIKTWIYQANLHFEEEKIKPVETYSLEDADNQSKENARVIFISENNLYAAPKNGSYRILICENVQNAFINRGTVFFSFKKEKKLQLMCYGNSAGIGLPAYIGRYTYYRSQETDYIYYDFCPKDGIKWFKMGKGSVPIGEFNGTIGVGYTDLDEERVRHWDAKYFCIDKDFTYTNVLRLTDSVDFFTPTVPFEYKDRVLVDGWNVSKVENTLAFSSGSTINKISGKNLFLVGSI